ncbi:MAG TPA: AAA family ATPase [Actinophytocola sp.]|uniref:AAA family ATPase n=1 Tax=Actinophytocola sp. TaxID=1872138 RepID=UPI002DBE2CAB|nr:AAA family ATPase [Actinophytocola sp.]HEU5471044.1 AAA family ATPase [Actinophytocola sp.]
MTFHACPGRGVPIRLATSDIVGRDAELGMLRSALAGVRTRGATIFVVGEPGLGKTRLVREAARIAESSGRVVLRGRATSPLAQFRALSEACLSVFRHRGVPDAAELAPYRHALSRLIPDWRAERMTAADDSVVVLAEAVLRLLRWVAGGSGCLVTLDDLHDADADTLAVVDYLADNLAGEPVLLVGTVRPEPGPAIDLVRAACRRGAAIVVELSPLDGAGIRRLVAGCLGVDSADVPAETLGRLLADGGGNPFYVEELLAEMVGGGQLVRSNGAWHQNATVRPAVPASVLASVTARVRRLGPHGPRVLRAASVFGQHFSAALVGAVSEVDDAELRDVLRSAVGARLVDVADDGYLFRHALTVEALRTELLPGERSVLSARAAEAIEAAQPDLPGEWCRLAGELWERAGAPARAAELFGRVGRRAVRQGALATAIALLERGLALLEGDRLGPDPASVLEPLLEALVAAGQVDRARELGARFDLDAGPHVRARVHLRLARAAAAAGQWSWGRGELDRARRLIESGARPAAAARVDVVAAQLAFTDPEPDRLARAEELAARALRSATEAGLPEIACEALELLGTCARVRDLDEAEARFGAALDLAERHDLALWRIRLLFDLGVQAGIHVADPARLVEARDAAHAAGALVTALDIVAELAVVQLIRGEYGAAERNARECEETARRLRLADMSLTALGLRVCISAHQGRRAETMALLEDYERRGGAGSDFSSALWGFGLAFCSLLEEDRPRALAEFDQAAKAEANRPPQYLSYVHGPRLFLAVLEGGADRLELTAARRSASGQARWNRVFLALADAVLSAREGRAEATATALAEFEAAAEPFPLARHLGLRLLAEPALDGRWGEPARWLRTAEAFFLTMPAPQVAAAARALLRRAGEPVRHWRRGADTLPTELRLIGVTVREYEVLTLVAAGLSNREIGERLFVSRRTVETHVANLLAKTGQPNRVALARYADPRLPDVTGKSQ